MSIDWDQYFITRAYLVAMRSKDRDTHLGAIIVGPDNEVRSTGYNSFPRGVSDQGHPERQERPEKYFWFEHAERNAIYNASWVGVPLKSCRMYTNGVPCADCGRAVIRAGIREVIVDAARNSHNEPKWAESAEKTYAMFEAGGVKIRKWEGPLINVVKYRWGKIIE